MVTSQQSNGSIPFMTRLLRAGFQVLVLGLNLMAIRYILSITSPNPAEIVEKSIAVGSIITFIGFAIIIIGIVPLFLRKTVIENATILSIGPSVTTLGIAMIIRALGHGNENVIFIGAWAATGVGVALIFAYCIWYIVTYLKTVKRLRPTK